MGHGTREAVVDRATRTGIFTKWRRGHVARSRLVFVRRRSSAKKKYRSVLNNSFANIDDLRRTACSFNVKNFAVVVASIDVFRISKNGLSLDRRDNPS